jgi:hypothetical protein
VTRERVVAGTEEEVVWDEKQALDALDSVLIAVVIVR